LKKVIKSIVFGLMFVLMFNGIAFANSNSTNKAQDINSKLDVLSQKYDVKFEQVDIPEGITPVEYSSVEELEKDIAKFYKEQKDIKQKNKQFEEAPAEKLQILATSTGSQVKSFWVGSVPYLPPQKINIQVNYSYDSSTKRFLSCNSVNSWITGLDQPVGFKWTQKGQTTRIIDSGRTLTASVYGTMQFYVIIKGIGQLVTFNYTSPTAEYYLK